MSQIHSAVLAEDEPLLLRHLDNMLAEIWPELSIAAKCKNGQQALDAISANQPDVVFLDINMPGLDGITLAQKVSRLDKVPHIIFTTAYSDYAVQAFEQNAVDYVLKPLDETRLLTACQKVQDRLASPSPQSAPDITSLIEQLQAKVTPAASYMKWIRASKGDDIHLVLVDDVAYFKAEDKYVSVYCAKSENLFEEYIIRTSLKELTSQLDPDNFWQIHRSTIINVRELERVSKDFTGKMTAFVHGRKLPVSRASQVMFKGM
ncbi:LytR/AlgR family response regulator transcription factor [Veronia pacifica]|uniref:DNA-binding response regulator n=1 Tax=Veronia pacifica TaxID=1080227 RepID=A0A1C3ERS1_9GAMM|nr:LytTR family DNA-binding domain-containing protein [Veronia pacifica]ODA35888.1 DNA-binding response regulator [Veronia pacifica]